LRLEPASAKIGGPTIGPEQLSPKWTQCTHYLVFVMQMATLSQHSR
jgi:hypothetical protein